uniref:SMI1/KNR4 family protein n=1 Tax=Roseihalotalea indica TaxID=2867963 RepID=A0AA49JK54_9BACT|nr:SMI1/KNR4 family protein [Tunicatimonas sp. TK19036]
MITKDNNNINLFYRNIRLFLVEHGLEDRDRIVGYSDIEIEGYEKLYGIQFPIEYRLFLKYFAKGGMRFFCGQTFKLEKLHDAFEVACELLSDRNEKLGNECFVISQWQGYNFYYLNMNDAESKVHLYMEGKGTTEMMTFQNWIKWQIRADLKSREQIEKRDLSHIETELNKI